MKRKHHSLVIISAPSGCGKDTIIKEVCKRLDHIGVSISCTTRPPRKKKETGLFEQEGVDYFFIEKDEFEAKIQQNGFLEYASFNGKWYGTPCDYVDRLRAEGNDIVILNIENRGAMQVKAVDPTAVSIFILPPSAHELRQRLIDRKSETVEEIENRMIQNTEQVKTAYPYDYVVMNDVLEDAIQEVVHIICAVRRRTHLHKELIDQVSATFDLN